jgi:voltage-gated potassium channel
MKLHSSVGFFFYQTVLIFLALISVGIVVFETTTYYSEVTYSLISIIDISIACIFFIDFIVSLYRSANRKLFWKQRWWELFACIPFTTPITQSLRGLGILRLFRIVQVLSRLKRIDNWVRTLSYKIFALVFFTGTTIIVSASLFFSFEFGVNTSVTNYSDSLWWAVSTITTTGYGDIVPITNSGRILASFLMIAGVTLLGILVHYIVRNKE